MVRAAVSHIFRRRFFAMRKARYMMLVGAFLNIYHALRNTVMPVIA